MLWFSLIILFPYLYLILRIYRALHKIIPFSPTNASGIFVSVIVACRNEAEKIPFLLDDLAAQNYDHGSFELIVIDDNSTDDTFNSVSGYNKIKNLKIIRNKGNGKKSAIRTGIEISTGELIVTTDADCRTGPGWINSIVSFYISNKPGMIICPVSTGSGKGFFNKFQELDFLSLQGITAGTASAGIPVMCNGANLAYPKEVYERHAGNLHEELISGDDVFLLHSIRKEKGTRILWLESEEAMVTTETTDGLMAFLHQRSRWLSKAGSYVDKWTQVLGVVTFFAVSLQALMMLAGFFNHDFLIIYAASVVLKSVPDLAIVVNTCTRYRKRNLIKWFLPAQMVYPFYVLAVAFLSLKGRDRW
jgi:cellulose synthase/poly-beta-1,6-N-acetylglucosamine synthase-like glycosyltransferase